MNDDQCIMCVGHVMPNCQYCSDCYEKYTKEGYGDARD